MRKIVTKIFFWSLVGLSIFFLTAAVIFFLFVFGGPFARKKHDLNLQKFIQEFDRIPFPSDSKQLGDLYKEFGLMGNGNHCDYYTSKLVESGLTEKELQIYFNNFLLNPVDPTERMEYSQDLRGNTPNSIWVSQPWKRTVVFGPYFGGTEEEKRQEAIQIQNNEKGGSAKQHSTKPELITDKVFLISSHDSGYKANDLRCH